MPKPEVVEVVTLGEVKRITYVRDDDGKTYEHEFSSPVVLNATVEGDYLILSGGNLEIDGDGWIHG